jgi:hypothetical protein
MDSFSVWPIQPEILISHKGGVTMKCVLPSISDCTAEGCAYNNMGQCHAMAVTIGDGMNPKCDTSMISIRKGGVHDITGGVGACKVAGCTFNNSLECSAQSISVLMNSHEALCSTYRAR